MYQRGKVLATGFCEIFPRVALVFSSILSARPQNLLDRAPPPPLSFSNALLQSMFGYMKLKSRKLNSSHRQTMKDPVFPCHFPYHRFLRMKKKPTKVYRYDGQSIWTSADSSYSSYSDYELGSFLGGGAAGVVYEAECLKTERVSFCRACFNTRRWRPAPSGVG